MFSVIDITILKKTLYLYDSNDIIRNQRKLFDETALVCCTMCP